ncbi:MAG: diguanylate cyclase [Ruegeria sp.]
MNILADLKSRMGTRRTALIAIIDEDNATVAVDALDRGADAVCLGGFCADEVSLRIKALLARKAYNDDLRAKYRRGLEESWIDPLTGLNNRRYAISAMDQLMQCAEHRGHSFAVMLADLDHFKSINDHFGHTNGDRVLIEAANRMKLAFGTDGFVSRIGGEEFLFGMPDAPREKAMRKAAEVRRKVCGEPIVLPDISARLTVTVSIGLKVCDPPFPNQTTGRISTDNLMKCADKALYTAKKAGRNRVRLGLSAA